MKSKSIKCYKQTGTTKSDYQIMIAAVITLWFIPNGQSMCLFTIAL